MKLIHEMMPIVSEERVWKLSVKEPSYERVLERKWLTFRLHISWQIENVYDNHGLCHFFSLEISRILSISDIKSFTVYKCKVRSFQMTSHNTGISTYPVLQNTELTWRWHFWRIGAQCFQMAPRMGAFTIILIFSWTLCYTLPIMEEKQVWLSSPACLSGSCNRAFFVSTCMFPSSAALQVWAGFLSF